MVRRAHHQRIHRDFAIVLPQDPRLLTLRRELVGHPKGLSQQATVDPLQGLQPKPRPAKQLPIISTVRVDGSPPGVGHEYDAAISVISARAGIQVQQWPGARAGTTAPPQPSRARPFRAIALGLPPLLWAIPGLPGTRPPVLTARGGYCRRQIEPRAGRSPGSGRPCAG